MKYSCEGPRFFYPNSSYGIILHDITTTKIGKLNLTTSSSSIYHQLTNKAKQHLTKNARQRQDGRTAPQPHRNIGTILQQDKIIVVDPDPELFRQVGSGSALFDKKICKLFAILPDPD
jgi:hypothetical protein